MKKIMIAIMFLNGFVYGQNQSTNTIGSEVPVYEYVPKVIIEGKWGKGEGEFGREIIYEDSERFIYGPGSLAVNSKGDIYVLDQVNNRIQKFNKDGKYLLSIPVNSFKIEPYCWMIYTPSRFRYVLGSIKESEYGDGTHVVRRYLKYEGINIVIDSKDRLYYYVKNIEDLKMAREEFDDYPKEELDKIKLKSSGEVWEFVDDKLRKKVPFEKRNDFETKLDLISIGYNQWAIGISSVAAPPVKVKMKKKYKVDIKQEKEESIFKISNDEGVLLSSIKIKPSEIYRKANIKYGRSNFNTYLLKEEDNGNVVVKVIEGFADITSIEEQEYTMEGKLVKIIKLSSLGSSLETDNNGVKVIDWVLKRVR